MTRTAHAKNPDDPESESGIIRIISKLYKSASGVVMVRDRALVVFLSCRWAIFEQLWCKYEALWQPEVGYFKAFRTQPPTTAHFDILSNFIFETIAFYQTYRVSVELKSHIYTDPDDPDQAGNPIAA